MLLDEIKELIYLIESSIKDDKRFDTSLRSKTKYLFKNNKIKYLTPNYVPVPVPIIDTKKIKQLENENDNFKNVLIKLQNLKELNENEFKINLEKIEKALNDINIKIQKIIT